MTFITYDAGHKYGLYNVDGGDPQVLQFIQKTPVAGDKRDLVTVVNGTTNETVIAVLIDRLQFLGGVLPSEENERAVFHLKEALIVLNQRTADRKARGVEGTYIK